MKKQQEKNNESFSSLDENWETDVPTLTNDVSSIELDEKSEAISWISLLGVSMKPNPLDDWDQLYNLNNQCALRNDCRKLANVLKNKRSVPELESFLTLYCKKRDVDYVKNNGWLTVLEKLLLLDVPQHHEFNVFFAFTTKYLPKDTRSDAQIFDLFRLLLQYHDPQLSNHLESLKCTPYFYARNWFETLFASSMSTESSHALWKLYIERGDPFLVFHLAIVFLINAKEEILQVKHNRDKENVVNILENMAAQINVDDVPDFFQLATHYSDMTPECIRKDFHYIIFGANFDEDVKDVQLKNLICLPIPAIDLTFNDEIMSGKVNFFIVDTRSNADFDSGHFVSSFNLDCIAIVDEPEKFEIALQSLECYKSSRRSEDHYLILGYGTDSHDQYMNMLIAMFIQKTKAHVSFVQGGFQKLHDCIGHLERWNLIAMHSEDKCKLCNSEKNKPKWGFISKMKSAVSNTSNRMKERVEAVVFPIGEVKHDEIHSHVDSKQRHGKRYRQQSVFTIDENSDDEITTGAAVDENPKEEILLSKEFTETFECKEVFLDGNINGHIALTRTHIHVLHDVPGKKGYVTTEARHALSTVIAVTSRKSIPELLTFKLGYELNGTSKITAVHKLYVPKAGECAKAVKTAIFALRPLGEA